MIYFIWFVLVVSILNLAMLSFAFRDFSFLLVLQFLFSAVGLPIATYLITKHDLLHWFMTYDKENLTLNMEDEITEGSMYIYNGEILDERTKEAID